MGALLVLLPVKARPYAKAIFAAAVAILTVLSGVEGLNLPDWTTQLGAVLTAFTAYLVPNETVQELE